MARNGEKGGALGTERGTVFCGHVSKPDKHVSFEAKLLTIFGVYGAVAFTLPDDAVLNWSGLFCFLTNGVALNIECRELRAFHALDENPP